MIVRAVAAYFVYGPRGTGPPTTPPSVQEPPVLWGRLCGGCGSRYGFGHESGCMWQIECDHGFACHYNCDVCHGLDAAAFPEPEGRDE